MTQELRRLAEAAINDEWRHVPSDDCHGHYIKTCGSDETICDLYFTTNKRHDFRNAEQNAAYIAAANPAVILSLLDRLEKAEKAMEQQKDEWLSWHAKREQLEKDAARYQWLRERYTAVNFDWEESGQQAVIFTADDFPVATASCDETIDRAMEASK